MWHTRYPDDLDLPQSGRDRLIPRGWVGSRGPVNIGWQLSIALQKYGGYREGVDLHPFFYDWRLSARETGAQLGDFVDNVRGNGKVDIVAHSAGALVALAYVRLHGGQNVENLILIAPASGGVIDAFRVFVRPEKLIRREFKPEVVATWPFIFELLPENGRIFVDEEGRPLERDLWDPAAWPFDVRQRLAEAKAFREELRAARTTVPVTVIACDCVPTATKILQRRDGTYAFYPDDLRPGERRLARLLFEPGDGTIPLSSARTAGEPALFCDGHQGIAADPNVHRALVRRLRP
jgi:pimeloyl-ACP methyl ester carboxylesterase